MDDAVSTLDQLLDPLAECITPEVARRIAELQTSSTTMARLEYLRLKANEGALSPEELSEYEELVDGIDLLSILKAKSREILDAPTE